jgi:hypothetical protein
MWKLAKRKENYMNEEATRHIKYLIAVYKNSNEIKDKECGKNLENFLSEVEEIKNAFLTMADGVTDPSDIMFLSGCNEESASRLLKTYVKLVG